MKREFTANCFILDNKKILLIYHKKLKKWLPPGGHIEPNEAPSEAALREVLEETGLIVELIPQENIHINRHNGRSLPRPYLCLLEEIPSYGSDPAHQHIDFCYVAKPAGGALLHNEKETGGLRWFTQDEIMTLMPEVDIFIETRNIIIHLFEQYGK